MTTQNVSSLYIHKMYIHSITAFGKKDNSFNICTSGNYRSTFKLSDWLQSANIASLTYCSSLKLWVYLCQKFSPKINIAIHYMDKLINWKPNHKT